MSIYYPKLEYTDREGPRYVEEYDIRFSTFAKHVLDHADMAVEDPDTGVTTHYIVAEGKTRVIGLEVGIGLARRYIYVKNDTIETKKEQIIPDLPRFHESN